MDKSKEVVERNLRELGYFKYSDSEEIVDETFKDYKGDGVIHFPWNGLNRTFGIDAEFIYEAGGLESHIKGLVTLFDKFGITLNVGDCIEEFDNSSSTYTKREITINGNKYSTPNVNEWGSAFNSGFKITNQLLEDYNFDGKVYGLFMDESSTLIVLNQEQFDYLTKLIPEGATYRPIDIAKMMIDHYGE